MDVKRYILGISNIKEKYINILFEKEEIEVLNNIRLQKENKYKLQGYFSVEKFFITFNISKDINSDSGVKAFIDTNIEKINFNNLALSKKDDIKNIFYNLVGYIEFVLDAKTRVGVGYGIVYNILFNIFENEYSMFLKNIKIKRPIEIKHKKYIITLTYGEVAENHVGMQKLGNMCKEGNGLNIENLRIAKNNFEKLGFKCQIIDLIKEGDVGDIIPSPQPAYVLLIKNGIKALTSTEFDINEINQEVLKDTWDTKAFMKGRVVNKLARYNLNYADESQEPDYENKKGRVVAFKDAPIVEKIREEMPNFFGTKTNKLFAEGNFYYDLSKCGIGFHGDSERRIVVAVRLGDSSMPIHYQWFQQSSPIGKRIIIDLNPGDVYAMSEIAVGTNWKKKIIPTLRHATGCKKYLQTK
jgi:hypothetical protein